MHFCFSSQLWPCSQFQNSIFGTVYFICLSLSHQQGNIWFCDKLRHNNNVIAQTGRINTTADAASAPVAQQALDERATVGAPIKIAAAQRLGRDLCAVEPDNAAEAAGGPREAPDQQAQGEDQERDRQEAAGERDPAAEIEGHGQGPGEGRAAQAPQPADEGRARTGDEHHPQGMLPRQARRGQGAQEPLHPARAQDQGDQGRNLRGEETEAGAHQKPHLKLQEEIPGVLEEPSVGAVQLPRDDRPGDRPPKIGKKPLPQAAGRRRNQTSGAHQQNPRALGGVQEGVHHCAEHPGEGDRRAGPQRAQRQQQHGRLQNHKGRDRGQVPPIACGALYPQQPHQNPQGQPQRGQAQTYPQRAEEERGRKVEEMGGPQGAEQGGGHPDGGVQEGVMVCLCFHYGSVLCLQAGPPARIQFTVFCMSEESCQDPSSISQFACKLFRMLETPTEAIEWRADLSGFVIRDIKLLETRVLPLYFRHSHYSSFVRQLNMYDFHKVRTHTQDTLFCHSGFTKLSCDLLMNIRRKRQKKEDSGEADDLNRERGKENQLISRKSIREGNHQKEKKHVHFDQGTKEKDSRMLIEELVDVVRERAANQKEARKLVYELRRRPEFRPLAGSKHLTEIYGRLNFPRDQLEELSIEEEICNTDKHVVPQVKSLAFLQSEYLLRKAGSTYFNIEDEADATQN